MERTETVGGACSAVDDVAVPAEMATLLARAQAATRARDEILAAVSHDLRAPLTAISIARQLICRELDLTPDEGNRLHKYLATISRCTARMTRLTNDLLDLASIESGRLSIQPEPRHIREAVQETVECFDAQAVTKGIRLEGDVDPGLPMISYDKDRLLQVLGNLVSNALRFTTAGGSVHIRAQREGRAVLVSVCDTGTGMAPDALAHVFDRHWQATRRHEAGYGLGLAISKAIIEAHEGTIFADSAVGRGTTVAFTLPALAKEATSTPPSQAQRAPAAAEAGGRVFAHVDAASARARARSAAEPSPDVRESR